jgi:hypothetical protein
MALTWPRWIAIATAAALVVIGVSFARTARQDPPIGASDAMRNQAERYAWEARRLAARYRVLVLRDSLQAKGHLAPATTSQTVIIDPRLDGAARLEIESAMRRANTLASIQAPRVPVVLAFVIDTARSVRGVSQHSQLAVHYLLPGDSLGVCTVLVRVGGLGPGELERVTRQLHRDRFVTGLFGPCAFYAAFGAPGPDITAWLRSTGYAFTLAAGWSIPARAEPRHALTAFAMSRWMDDWNPRDDLLHCLAQEPAPCAAEIQAIRRRDGLAVWGGVVDQARGDEFSYQDWRGVGATLLSDMVREYGEERFGRFWRSDRPVADAFREATGEDLGTAAVRRTQARFIRFETGPDMTNKALLNGLVLLTVGLIGTFAAAARTRVV